MSTFSLIPLFDTLEQIEENNPNVISYLESFQNPEYLREYALTLNFLKSYAGSLDTFNAYRREIERLLHFCWTVQNISLVHFTRDKLRLYIDFCRKPPQNWIAHKQCARFIEKEGVRVPNPQWKPFVTRATKAERRHGIQSEEKDYHISPKSLQALLATLSTFFNFLQQEDYLYGNPVQMLRQKNRIIQREQSTRVTRKLSRVQWRYVIETLQVLAEKQVHYERSLFLMSAFYLLGLRISELAQTTARTPKMSDFAPDKEGSWWFTTIGKGNKKRDVAVPDEMLSILKHYRQSLNLTPLPYRGESTPILSKERGSGALGIRQIRKLVQDCFDAAISRLLKDGLSDEAEDLAAATVHWLRHTSISHDIEFRSREHVRDDAGHGNENTTGQYIEDDRRARHASARLKSLKEKE